MGAGLARNSTGAGSRLVELRQMRRQLGPGLASARSMPGDGLAVGIGLARSTIPTHTKSPLYGLGDNPGVLPGCGAFQWSDHVPAPAPGRDGCISCLRPGDFLPLGICDACGDLGDREIFGAGYRGGF